MLQVTIPAVPGIEYYDEKTQMFMTLSPIKEQVLQLEHSLISLSRWEEKWCKPFLGNAKRTNEECTDYIRCMTLTKNVDLQVYKHIPTEIFAKIDKYIEAPMTATWFKEQKGVRRNKEVITAEIIYYWMIALNIPFECQKWHLNKLLALIRVCNEKNAPQKKMGRKDIYNHNRALNARRRSQLGTRG